MAKKVYKVTLTIQRWKLMPCLWMIAFAYVAAWIDEERAHELVNRAALRSFKIKVEPDVGSLEA